jgi:hypothetical protein
LSIQLFELWKQQPQLWLFREKLNKLTLPEGRKETRLANTHSLKKVGPFWCLPLVSRESQCTCEVSVVFLRRGYPGDVMMPTGGDLDNRLKTLFDGLRMPQNEPELAGDTPRASDPFLYCLLEDDGLITKVSVEAKRLLSRQTKAKRHDVEVTIDIVVKPWSLAFRRFVEIG